MIENVNDKKNLRCHKHHNYYNRLTIKISTNFQQHPTSTSHRNLSIIHWITTLSLSFFLFLSTKHFPLLLVQFDTFPKCTSNSFNFPIDGYLCIQWVVTNSIDIFTHMYNTRERSRVNKIIHTRKKKPEVSNFSFRQIICMSEQNTFSSFFFF
jgi:hypothetical protein